MTVWVMKINTRVPAQPPWPCVLKWKRAVVVSLPSPQPRLPPSMRGGVGETMLSGLRLFQFPGERPWETITSKTDKTCLWIIPSSFSLSFSTPTTSSLKVLSCGPVLPSFPLENCTRPVQPGGSFGYHLDLPCPTGNVHGAFQPCTTDTSTKGPAASRIKV